MGVRILLFQRIVLAFLRGVFEVLPASFVFPGFASLTPFLAKVFVVRVGIGCSRVLVQAVFVRFVCHGSHRPTCIRIPRKGLGVATAPG